MAMRIARVQETADSIHLTLADRATSRAEEVRPGIVVQYDERGAVIGIDVQRALTEPPATDAEPDGLPKPQTELMRLAMAARAEYEASGAAFLTPDELDRETIERRSVPTSNASLVDDLLILRDRVHARGIGPMTVEAFDRELAERRGE